jgi:hypothetical protein
VGLPGFVGDDGLPRAVGTLDFHVKQKARLAQRRCAIALTVEQNLGANHVGTRGQGRAEVERVGFHPARIAGRRSPLNPPAIHFEQIAAVGRNPTAGTHARGREVERAPE